MAITADTALRLALYLGTTAVSENLISAASVRGPTGLARPSILAQP
jgi:hypothetical protein